MTPLNDVNVQLREADPVPREPGLTPDAVSSMRGTILTATLPTVPPFSHGFANAFAMAGFAFVTIVLCIVGLRRADTVRVGSQASPAETSALGNGGRTQLLFSTPGGTRIIWTIDPGFYLKEAR
jgi:hypothetical protein